MTVLGPRFIQSVTSVLRPICEVRQMLAEEDKTAINEGLTRICEKSEIVTLGEMVQCLALDVILILQDWYSENAACVSMSLRIAEAERDLVAALEEIKQWCSV